MLVCVCSILVLTLSVSDALDVYPSVYANPNPASLPGGGHNSSGEGCNVSNHSGAGGGGTSSQTPSVR